MVTPRRKGGKDTGASGQSASSTPAASTEKGPANTPAHIYLDTANFRKVCDKELKKIQDACKPDNPKKLSMADKLMGEKAASKINEIKNKIAQKGAAQWVLDHCDGLYIKPISPEAAGDKAKAIGEIAGKLQELDTRSLEAQVMAEVRKRLNVAVEALETAIVDAAEAAAIRSAAKKAGSWGIGTLFGPVGLVVAAIFNTVDTAISAAQLANKLSDLREELMGLKKIVEELPGKLQGIVDEAAKNPQKAVADVMSIMSRLNDCMRARRCQLVPMKETHEGNKSNCDDVNDSEKESIEVSGPSTGKGCCPGQTGHHVLPGAMFKDCTAYKTWKSGGCPHQSALTICVEGVNNSHGSHGQMHGQLGAQLEKKYPGGKISLDDAIDEGVESVRKVFPESGCRKACLRAQLEKFYEPFKGCSPLIANPGKSRGGGNKGGKS
ncbi:MAG: hypothetical protein LBF61_11050 [Azoarcus sp.]|jgi:hypothetical protein|nr:hypothetical protein [Azoarcus sp.]